MGKKVLVDCTVRYFWQISYLGRDKELNQKRENKKRDKFLLFVQNKMGGRLFRQNLENKKAIDYLTVPLEGRSLYEIRRILESYCDIPTRIQIDYQPVRATIIRPSGAGEKPRRKHNV